MTPRGSTAQPGKPLAVRLRLAGLAATLALTGLAFVFRDQLHQLHHYGYAGIFLLSAIGNASLVLPLPAVATAFVGGGAFNPLAVGVVAASGATIGELTGYLVGASGQAAIANHKLYDRVDGWMRRHGLMTLFALAAVPNPFFDIAGITAGALRFPVRHFLLTTWAGKIVKLLAIAYLGARLLGA